MFLKKFHVVLGSDRLMVVEIPDPKTLDVVSASYSLRKVEWRVDMKSSMMVACGSKYTIYIFVTPICSASYSNCKP